MKQRILWFTAQQEIDLEFDEECEAWTCKHRPLNTGFLVQEKKIPSNWIVGELGNGRVQIKIS